MKSFLFLVLLSLAFFVPLHAQYPYNPDFEDSVLVTGNYEPRYWTNDSFGFAYTNDAHSGSKAAQIWNWYYYARAYLVNGYAPGGFFGGGMPVTSNPSVLSGWYKYEYGLNDGAADSAVVQVLVTNAADDTLAWVEKHLGPASSYTEFTVPIEYRVLQQTADTMVIRFLSSVAGFCSNSSSGECLYFTVDDLEVNTILGTSERMDFEPRLTLAPSPSSQGFLPVFDGQGLYPCTLRMYDAIGRLAYSTHLSAAPTQRLQPQLPRGHYQWEVVGADGMRHSGKWTATE